MNWVLASFIMFFSSAVLYLVVRKSSLLKTPTQLNNLAMFSLPLLIYFIIGTTTKQNYFLPLTQLFIIIIASVFFSYLGNVFSLKSIELAPNAGYSLVISKSYVVFTTLVAVTIFNARLTLKSAFAIGLIVFFSALIVKSGLLEWAGENGS